jgi:hypothetical protein
MGQELRERGGNEKGYQSIYMYMVYVREKMVTINGRFHMLEGKDLNECYLK